MKRILFSSLIVILLSSCFLMFPRVSNASPGAITITLSPLTGTYQSRNAARTGGGTTWAACCTSAMLDTGGAAGADNANFIYYNSTDWITQCSLIGYDLSSLPANVTITNVYIISNDIAYVQGGSPSSWKYSYVTYYALPGYPANTSFNPYLANTSSGYIPLFQPHPVMDFPTSNTTNTYFSIYSDWISKLTSLENVSGQVYFEFTYQRVAQNIQPDNYSSGANVQVQTGSGSKPLLVITYVPSSESRIGITPRSNGNPYYLTTGNETTSNITWDSPRCAFSDEAMSFLVSGNMGANVTLSLVKADGSALLTHNDSIRDTGYYVWTLPTLPNYNGFVRCVEANSGVVSDWGYIAPAPAASINNLGTYVNDTKIPQISDALSTYTVYQDGYCFVYWDTNMIPSDYPNYSLGLWESGNYAFGNLYDKTFSFINSNYLECGYSNYQVLDAFRYMIVSPNYLSAGLNDYNGMIVNLRLPYNIYNSGFIVPVVHDTGGNSITTCYSAMWYLQNVVTDGVSVNVIGGQISSGSFGIDVYAGQYSHVGDRLNNCTLTLNNQSDGSFVSTNSAVLISGDNDIPMTAPAGTGNYLVTVTLSSVTSAYFSYVTQTTFTIVNGATPTPAAPGLPTQMTIPQIINSLLAQFHINNTFGHWLIIIISMAICIAVGALSKNRLAMIGGLILALLVFGAAIVAGWVDPWIIVLLALVAGGAVWGMLRHKATGSNEG